MTRRARIVSGASALLELEELAARWPEVDIPITARPRWLRCYLESSPGMQAIVVVVEEGARTVAVACLGRAPGLIVEWTALGHSVSDYAVLPAADADAARLLAAAIAEAVHQETRPWRLRLDQVAIGDPVLAQLRAQLQNVHVKAGISAFRLSLTEPREFNRHVAKSARRSRTKGWNRLERDGHHPELVQTRDAVVVETMLDRVIELRRSRDHQVRGFSDADDAEFLSFYRAIMLESAEAGELELTMVLVDEKLIGYVFGFLDGASYRVWDGRVDSAWTHYSTGNICNFEAVQSALSDPRMTTFDWMRGEQEYKKSAMTEVAEFEHLHAWSSPSLRLGLRIAAGIERRFHRSMRRLRRPGGAASRTSPEVAVA